MGKRDAVIASISTALVMIVKMSRNSTFFVCKIVVTYMINEIYI